MPSREQIRDRDDIDYRFLLEAGVRIGLVTCKVLPEPDPDARPLARAIRAAGHEPVEVPWDGDGIPLATVDHFVLRSCWNYFEAPDAFRAWIERAASQAPVINSPEVVSWNVHKRYLLTLESAGVPVIPTVLVRRGHDVKCVDLDELSRHGAATPNGKGLVIKPAVSAGSAQTRRFGADERAQAQEWLEHMLGGMDVLIQPYVDSFREPGERALIWIDGEWTHAVRKHPRFLGQDECVEASFPPTGDELEVADAALAVVPHRLAYARADLVTGADGSPMISELELMEPSLFFEQNEKALHRFIDVITRTPINTAPPSVPRP
ncbi:MAG: ATP-grasp domain-containing protein [Planctomycetota bacterium]|jgi:hypothetical protein